jgi:hypothetical protein
MSENVFAFIVNSHHINYFHKCCANLPENKSLNFHSLDSILKHQRKKSLCLGSGNEDSEFKLTILRPLFSKGVKRVGGIFSTALANRKRPFNHFSSGSSADQVTVYIHLHCHF